ncbi:hypothetical protein [Winogradskyella sp.]|uniref:hypothetical protein n=1 Tax=Winogradskyella sp. TaxID=1883156 RepID=UPI001B289ABB|nr:hypothetical protein [Winogradskyella sp.]MBO6881781.1 hypothetical protein [Winogradskyella sp.]
MELIVTPRYSDIFDEDEPDLQQLLSTFPSTLSIFVLSKINAEIYLSNNLQKDLKILHLLTQRFDYGTKQQIARNISIFIRANGEKIQLFTKMANLEFMHLELINFRKGNIIDSSPLQELNFFKAYFLIVERLNKKFTRVYNNNINTEGDFFQTHTWPTLIQQIIASNRTSLIPNLIKGRAFLNFFENSPLYEKNVKKFLSYNNQENASAYIMSLLSFLANSFNKDMRDSNGKFILNEINSNNTLIQNYLLNIDDYKKKYGANYRNYTGLLEKPIFSMDSENCIVLNWDFMAKKLYDGLIFDFYEYSEIKNERKFKSFPDFKNFIGSEITEQYFFKKLIKKVLHDKHGVLKFDEDQKSGYPDAYFRKGKYIYLFEIKDSYFPVDAVNSDSVKEITKAIDKKYNTEKKGIGQLIKHIKNLTEKPYENSTYKELNLKKRNLVIYPIMIYTDSFFGMPGINNYLNKQFKSKLEDNKLDIESLNIKPLTFINMNFFIDYINQFEKIKFQELLDQYHKFNKNLFKISLKRKDMSSLFKYNENFESFTSKRVGKKFKEDQNYLTTIFKVLGFGIEFPKKEESK